MDYNDFSRYWAGTYIGIKTKDGIRPFYVSDIGDRQIQGVYIEPKGVEQEHAMLTWEAINVPSTVFKTPPPNMVMDGKGVVYISMSPVRQWKKGYVSHRSRTHVYSPFSQTFRKATGFTSSAANNNNLIWNLFNPVYYTLKELETKLQAGTLFGGPLCSTMALCISEKHHDSMLLYKEQFIGEYKENKIVLYPNTLPYADHVQRELQVEVQISE